MYGFIGLGNMSSALATGMIKSGFTEKDNIFFYEINAEVKQRREAELEITAFDSLQELIDQCEYIVLGIKPGTMMTVLDEVQLYLRKSDITLISLAAGISTKILESRFVTSTPIVRVMSSVNSASCEAATAICKNTHVSPERYETILRLFNSVGKVYEIEEEMFGPYTAIASSSPAFTYLYIDALANSGLRLGIPKKLAREIAAQAVLGSAKAVLDTGIHPWELIDNVCSAGGMTIEGINDLQKHGFESSISEAIDAAVKKEKELF